jgi:hypothetical protein
MTCNMSKANISPTESDLGLVESIDILAPQPQRLARAVWLRHLLPALASAVGRPTGNDRLANQSYGQLTLAKELTSDLERDVTSP